MTSQTRATLKGYFNTNDQPTEAQFADLIDSGLNLADETNWTLGSGVDEYALVYDHDTARFVLRAPFAGLLATGATVGATSQAQAFTLGVVSPFTAPAADSTTAWQVRKADKATAVVTVDTTNARVGIGTTSPGAKLDINGASLPAFGGYTILQLSTTDTYGAGVGAAILFGGKQNGNASSGDQTQYAIVGGVKENATANNTDGKLIFGTRQDGSGAEPMIRMTMLSSGNVGINDTAPAEKLDVTGNINATGVYKVDDVQVLSNRVIDARCADVANSGDATTDGLIDALRDAMVAHGLIAASA